MNTLKEKYPLISALTTYINKCYDFDDALIAKLTADHENHIKSDSSTGFLPKYFGSVLHDSPVINIKFGHGDLDITIDDILAFDFAEQLRQSFNIKIDQKKTIYPVTIKFKQARIQLSRINNSGKFIYANKDKYIPGLSYWLYDEISKISENAIHAGIYFATHYKGNKGKLLLEIQAEQLEIDEKQKVCFLDVFGRDHLSCWDCFNQQRQKEGYLSPEKIALILKKYTQEC